MIGQRLFSQLIDILIEAFARTTNCIGIGVDGLRSQAFKLQELKVSPVVALERGGVEDKAGILKYPLRYQSAPGERGSVYIVK